jgi:replication-associated recombination protein RarA
MALVLANAAFQAAEFIGWPEARIPIAEATIYIATANKRFLYTGFFLFSRISMHKLAIAG